jgi:hypothetical protein
VKLGGIDIALSVHETHQSGSSNPFPCLTRACACHLADSPHHQFRKCVVVGDEDGKTDANQERDRACVSSSDR